MVRIRFALERFNTPLRVFVGTVLCASGLRRRARFAAAADAAGGSGAAPPSPAAGSVLQKLNSHGPHHATRCAPHQTLCRHLTPIVCNEHFHEIQCAANNSRLTTLR